MDKFCDKCGRPMILRAGMGQMDQHRCPSPTCNNVKVALPRVEHTDGGNRIKPRTVEVLVDAPENPAVGHIYCNMRDNTTYVWSGELWMDVGSIDSNKEFLPEPEPWDHRYGRRAAIAAQKARKNNKYIKD